MEQDNRATISSTATYLGGKSWTAYLGVGFFAVVFLLLVTPAAWAASWMLGLPALVLSVLVLGYKVLLLRSYKLYYDDVGVWLYSGVLPWKKVFRASSGATWMSRSTFKLCGAGSLSRTPCALAIALPNPVRSF